ncbi:CDP-alcohol phosphatidyltransferase family protein [Flavimobilis sp. GY10621]|uniref:Phosphatidylinositol phosphate synthase n=1 Tax=Flavimobilis rhizosphaerae TaxID=2775421 RepID=A0ABR9DT73_9MICO|nr:CDP-alcohol phosphatidyltransferase family protein [Flavimobilis rhizosphaerae]MBD9700340.1 CDP-alcohol phosphatidyltransferase family protein [Flavimobilis rhizosphaerae]
MLDNLRSLSTWLFTPVAKLLLRLGVTPDAVTIGGTVGTVVAALWLFPTGHLVAGAWTIGALVLADALDGIMARTAGRSGAWGAFLDSTLDRVADAAIFAGLLLFFLREGSDTGVVVALACLALGAVVPYARARAEGLGMTAAVGVAERADRLAIALVATVVVGYGAPLAVLVWTLGVLAALSAITVVQRMATVHAQARALAAVRPAGEGE